MQYASPCVAFIVPIDRLRFHDGKVRLYVRATDDGGVRLTTPIDGWEWTFAADESLSDSHVVIKRRNVIGRILHRVFGR